MKKLKNVVNNAYIYSVVAKIVSVVTGLIYSILFSRYLGTTLRGEASIITNYATIISLILCLGIYQAYPYFRKKNSESIYDEYINNVFGLIILLFFICVFIIIIFRPSIKYILILIFSVLLMGVKQLNYVVLIENPKLRNTTNIKLDIFDILLLLFLIVFTKASYFYCVLFLTVKNIVFFVIAFLNLKVKVSHIRPTLKGIMPYIKYGIIPMFTIILMEINYKIDVIMLEFLNVSTASIGIYSLGVMLAEKLWVLPDALKDILLSKLSKGKTAEEVAKVTRVSFTLMLIMITCMILFGKYLITLMYGYDYQNAYYVSLIILAGTLGMVFYKMIYSYNVANGHKNVNFVILLLSACVNVILNYFLIPIYEINGAAIASLVSYSLCGLVFLIYFCQNTQIKYIDMFLIKKDDLIRIKKIINYK